MVNLTYYQPILNKVLLAFSVFVGVFYFYLKGKKLGFNRDRLLDISLFPSAVSFFVFNLLEIYPEIRGGVSVLVFLLTFAILVNRENWSFSRLADIAAEALTLSLIFAPFNSIYFNFIFLIIFILVNYFVKYGFRSGFLYYFISAIISVVFIVNFILKKRNDYNFNLWLALVIFTLAIIRLNNGGYFKEALGLFDFWNKFGASIRLPRFNQLTRLFRWSKVNAILLTPELRNNNKQILIRKKVDLNKRINELEGGAVLYDKQNNQKVKENNHIVTLIKDVENSLKDVDDALLRLAKGSYGVCENCQNVIDEVRLITYPEARFCQNCSGK